MQIASLPGLLKVEYPVWTQLFNNRSIKAWSSSSE